MTPPQSLLSAIERVADVSAAGKDDWLLPTGRDAIKLLEFALRDNSQLRLTVADGEFSYWTSSFRTAIYSSLRAPVAVFAFEDGGAELTMTPQDAKLAVRPIRYFG